LKLTQLAFPAKHAFADAVTLAVSGPAVIVFAAIPFAALTLVPAPTATPAPPELHVALCPATAAPPGLNTIASTGHSTVAPIAMYKFGVSATIPGGALPVNCASTLLPLVRDAVI
jgi:hypothetical protein